MKLLLHTCCGPCSIYPVRILRQDRVDVMGFFYGSNIHPYTECLRRRDTLTQYADEIGLKLIVSDAYDIEGFMRNAAYREKNRCTFCYHDRLTATAVTAKHGQFDCFSTTLLYSRFQKHKTIQSIGEAVAQEVGIPFYYQDFRIGWKEGVDASKARKMYRQQYCGCLYSEKERYFR